MNNIWGDMSQYDPVTWHWVIAVYLFLAGLSAGAVMVALALRWAKGEQFESPIIKAAALVAPLAICLGMLCLVFDLTKPFHFWLILINYNLSSVMSIGVIALLLYIPLTFAYALLVFRAPLANWPLLGGVAEALLGWRKPLEVLLFGLGIVVGAYTGFLISAMNVYPMLNTAILPALFLVSGISAGAAANALVALIWFKTDSHSAEISGLHRVELPVVGIEMLFLLMLFSALYFKGGAAASALASLTTGQWAVVFWALVVGVGFGIPLLSRLLPAELRHGKGVTVLAACASLTGVLALRHFILYAGQSYIS
ncbi:polysulfide reductase NrfD [Shewanella avicenniae]|uniref:Polysulfide reductase NrfD n=1 Tax=Shewanella avicenniae TaxID=2814294 RepID=A0ABX7QQ59_9GAMM|nr:NrfD/PsrC family molybdoenzyme membrane anchor subunit [Shewanella avicenniae]QSX33157.1 polysulfide reductase NrfD [Shewanella avicenniae]